jgi:hypothetical protein
VDEVDFDSNKLDGNLNELGFGNPIYISPFSVS